MKTLIVYDSLYGNTEMIARAIGEAIPGEVRVLRVEQVKAEDWEAADLLVIGSPVHGALPTEAVQGLLSRIGSPGREGARAATFDTRLTWKFLERWGGFAAPKMADTLQDRGWTLVGEPGGFYVKGLKKGPLKRGEADRAAAWAQGLVERESPES
jgi:flavodoxin I